MADVALVGVFAEKWLALFQNLDTSYDDLFDEKLGNECQQLGFVMDQGQSFAHHYLKDWLNVKNLEHVIYEVNDKEILGAAIYSAWRHYAYWAFQGTPYVTDTMRQWFKVALYRLSRLVQLTPFAFRGTLRKMKISSNNMSYFNPPRVGETYQQNLTLNNKGGLWFQSFLVSEDPNQESPGSKFQKHIPAAQTDKILQAVASYFRKPYDEIRATDIGTWELELTNTDGERYRYEGSLCANFIVDGIDLSDLIRDTLGMYELIVFDGQGTDDRIQNISVHYKGLTEIHTRMADYFEDNLPWDTYDEQIVIDRMSGMLRILQTIGQTGTITHTYQMGKMVSSLLNEIYLDRLFSDQEPIQRITKDAPSEDDDYTITITYDKQPEKIIYGSFENGDLPNRWGSFLETLQFFLESYGLGKVLNPRIFGKRKRRLGEYIFCSVVFSDSEKSYYISVTQIRFLKVTTFKSLSAMTGRLLALG